MPAFNYKAVEQTGKEKKGVVEADSPRQARDRLKQQGLLPLEVIEVKAEYAIKAKKDRRSFRWRPIKVKMSDLALLTRQFSSLLMAGLPVEESVAGVAEQTEKSQVKSVLIGVRSQVVEGRSLADSMEEFPGVFPKLYRATVRAGEKSGELSSVLNRLADYVEKQNRINQKIKQASIYPALLVIVSISILVFLLTYIVPKIVDVFGETGQALPLPTLVLLAVSHSIKVYGLYGLLLLTLTGFFFHYLLRFESFRARAQLFKLRVPLVGKLSRAINSARFLRTFGILFAAGVPVLDAMAAANEVVMLLPMKKSVTHAIEKVGEGEEISVTLKATGYFSPMSIHLIAIGEKTGQLENMLERSADQQDQDVMIFIESALTLFEPLMILTMGGMVLFIVLAVLLPIFNLDVLVQS